MRDFTKELPEHTEKYIGENDLFLQIFEGETCRKQLNKDPLCFLYTVPTQEVGCGANIFLTSSVKGGNAMS